MNRYRKRGTILILLCSIWLHFLPGTFSARVVTLESIELYATHEWFPSKPSVYFNCQGENKTYLPDVKKKDVVYNFKGAESWQPLTEFTDDKCKRCGLYEEDTIKSNDVFDEWELCPDEFTDDGKYMHLKAKEFNATFLCPHCGPSNHTVENKKAEESSGKKGMHVAVVIILTVLASIVCTVGLLAGYRYWQKKKREHDQARFLKLFEEGDDIEDELDLGHVI